MPKIIDFEPEDDGEDVDGSRPPRGGDAGDDAGATFASVSDAIVAAIRRAKGPSETDAVADGLLRDMAADAGRRDAAMFRDDVVAQVMSVLIGSHKPSALLIGTAGTGKTRIAEEVARRIAVRDATVPEALAGASVYELSLSSIVAGSGVVGEIESKIDGIVAFASDPSADVILFIDEMHQLVDVRNPSYSKIAQILKPALADGRLRVIGATTSQESAAIAEDPAFARRFSRIIVDELDRDQTIRLLEGMSASICEHYNRGRSTNLLTVDASVLPCVASTADRYARAGAHRPDGAITLLDRTCAAAVVKQRLRIAATEEGSPEREALESIPEIEISAEALRATAMRLMTGHAARPVASRSELAEALSPVRGQRDAVSRVIDAVSADARDLFPRERPLTMLFAGPSGCGKTEVAELLAERLTGSRPITVNMTEYAEPGSENRIIGSPPGYVDSDSTREMPFDALETDPYQVILLDEFEKAHESVQRLFMRVFDEGELTSARGRVMDFKRAVIIATTNAAHDGRSRAGRIGFSASPADDASGLTDWFDRALLNRFELIATFSGVSRETYVEILRDVYAEEVAALAAAGRRTGLPSELDADAAAELAEATYVPEFGARPARRVVRAFIEREI